MATISQDKRDAGGAPETPSTALPTSVIERNLCSVGSTAIPVPRNDIVDDRIDLPPSIMRFGNRKEFENASNVHQCEFINDIVSFLIPAMVLEPILSQAVASGLRALDQSHFLDLISNADLLKGYVEDFLRQLGVEDKAQYPEWDNLLGNRHPVMAKRLFRDGGCESPLYDSMDSPPLSPSLSGEPSLWQCIDSRGPASPSMQSPHEVSQPTRIDLWNSIYSTPGGGCSQPHGHCQEDRGRPYSVEGMGVALQFRIVLNTIPVLRPF